MPGGAGQRTGFDPRLAQMKPATAQTEKQPGQQEGLHEEVGEACRVGDGVPDHHSPGVAVDELAGGSLHLVGEPQGREDDRDPCAASDREMTGFRLRNGLPPQALSEPVPVRPGRLGSMNGREVLKDIFRERGFPWR